MENTIKDRLLFYIGSVGENPHLFENKAGLSNGFIKNLKSIGSAAVEKIHQAYPELSTDWLLFGEGDMLIAETIENTAENVSGGVIVQGQKILHNGDPDKLLEEMKAQREMFDRQLSEVLHQNSQLIGIIAKHNG